MKRVARAQPGFGICGFRGFIGPVVVWESLSCKIIWTLTKGD
jgi:hypothetical protein